MENKEYLKSKIKELSNEIINKSVERQKFQNLYFQLFELDKLKKKYLNKYFVYRNDCYSCPEKESDYWNVYYKVININEYGGIEAISLQKDRYGRIESQITQMSPELEEITKEEYIEETMKIVNDFMKRYGKENKDEW